MLRWLYPKSKLRKVILNKMSEKKKTIARDEVVAEILKKARADKAFKKKLFDNPQEALGQFGVTMPDATGEHYLGTIYAMYERAQFYSWFYKSILNELRDETDTLARGLCRTATKHEDMDWDFEVTKYATKKDK